MAGNNAAKGSSWQASGDRNLALDAIVSPHELQNIVDRYGENPEDWPLACRQPAQDLIDVCAEARDIIAQAKQLRIQLRKMGPAAPACFSDRIVALALELDPPDEEYYWLRN